MIYVDDAAIPFGRMLMCHMMAIPHNDEELIVFAESIGVRKKWFQDKPNNPHFDICLSKRELAISMGATPISWGELTKLHLEYKNKMKTENV